MAARLSTAAGDLDIADLYRTGESADCAEVSEGTADDNRFLTTFHYTNDAHRAQDTARLIRIAAGMGEELTLRADGCAARAAACALALCDGVTSAKLEDAALDLQEDADYLRDFFIPGICTVGGLEDCLALAKCPVERF